MHNFRELKIWQKGRGLVKDVYLITQTFPKEELYALTSQVRRSSISIPSNIAEGCGRGSNAQLSHFLDVAQGSSCELETQIILSYDLGFLDETQTETITEKINEIQKMIRGFKDSLDV